MILRMAGLIALALASPAVARDVREASVAHERTLTIEGGRNFRDVGGYRTVDGRQVRWGVLYRSGALGKLTPRGMRQIDRLGPAAIIDLRMTDERRQDTNNWLAASGHGYWTRDYALVGDAAALAFDLNKVAKLSPAEVRVTIAGGYRTMPRVLAPQMRELFARLAGDVPGPVVVNCTAGKDRTGIAVALVLAAVGVPDEAIRQDYLLSAAAVTTGARQALLARFPGVSPDVADILLGVESEYLDAAFDQIRQGYGSIEGYLERELGVGPRAIAALKRRLLVRS